MRHGESIANRKGLIVSDAANALNDYGLTSLGAEQVMNSALKTRLNEKVKIISSDYLRAKETADIVAKVLCANADPVLEPLLRERDFGTWELMDHANYEDVWQNDATTPEQTFNQVELISQVLTRGLTVIEKLEAQYQGQSILLVGHGDVLQILLAHYNGLDIRFHRTLASIKNAEIRVLPPEIVTQKIA